MERTKPDARPKGDPQSTPPPQKEPGDTEVTPLDEDKNVDDGIEVDET